MRFSTALCFALVVTLAGQALDIMVHLNTGTVVHFNYVAEKTFVVGLALLLFSWWMGAGWKKGAAFVFIASSMFYVYYLFAVPTLDRAVFTLDEQIKWVFIHFLVIYAPYLMTLRILDRALLERIVWKNENRKFGILAGGGLLLGGLMLFPGLEFIVNNNLVIGRVYNDHVALGIAFLTIGIAAAAKLLDSWQRKTPR